MEITNLYKESLENASSYKLSLYSSPNYGILKSKETYEISPNCLI